MLLHFFTVLPFLILLLFLYKHFFTSCCTGKNLPPSPKPWPIIGNLHQIGRLPHRSLHSLSPKHGELMMVYFGRKPVLVVSSSNAACQIMKTYDIIFADRPQLRIFKRLVYNCKDIGLAPYGDYWKHIRSICVLHLLSSKRVQSFQHIREEEVTHLIMEIGTTKSVNLSKLFVNFTSDVICRVAFGVKFKGETDGINFKELMEKHEELLGGFHVGEFIPWLSWINYVNGVETQIQKVAKDMNRCLERIIQQHIDRRDQDRDQSRVNENNHEEPKDLVDVLLELQQDDMNNSILDEESIKAIILDMFVAGTTSTYAALEWAMSELLRSPKAMESLTKEVRGVTGGDASIIFTENKLDKMPYLKAVIKETFRLHPSVPLLLPRISMQDAKINGYDIPARTLVMINAWAIHRDPRSWNEPEEFRPERFLDSPVDYKGQYFDLIPFGSGRRGCPGMLFAINNIELALANLIDKFDWRLPHTADGNALDMMEYPGLTAHRAVPLVAVATPYYKN